MSLGPADAAAAPPGTRDAIGKGLARQLSRDAQIADEARSPPSPPLCLQMGTAAMGQTQRSRSGVTPITNAGAVFECLNHVT
jgi:hypothetical protein